MKIDTITCHDVYNAGASLQAYALSKYLTSLGHTVKIIDYKPDYLSQHFSLTSIASSKFNKPFIKQLYILAKFPKRLVAYFGKRKRKYDEFTACLPLTERRYTSNEELKLNLPPVDVYFAGSDQIWNTMFKNGKDPAFYLDFAPDNAIKASYAASFATEDIVEDYKENIEYWLSNIDYISVRESSGVDIINRLGIDGVQTVLDPVFLLEANEWKKVEEPLNFKKPYLLIYDFDKSDNIKEFALKMAKEANLQIFSIQKLNYANKCFWNEGPAAFISLVRNAEFVISNSFHATAFSLIFNKPFVVFNRNEKINTRMQDLLKMVDLENRIVVDGNFSDIEINYTRVNQKLESEINKSKEYIEMVLKG